MEGVQGRNLPFFFYPIAYGRYPGYGPSYIYDHEYGEPNNKRRPGGRLYFITIQPAKSLTKGPHPEVPPMTLQVIADKPTLKEIKSAVRWSCSKDNFNGWIGMDKVRVSGMKKFKGPAEKPKGPVPEQVVVYYRGSSVALSLAGYNNTAQVTGYDPRDSRCLVDTPLPSVASTPFFQCINRTLGESIPLVVADIGAGPYQPNAALPMATPQLGLVTLLVLVLVVWRTFF